MAEEAELAARIEADDARQAKYEAAQLRAKLRSAGLFGDAILAPEDENWASAPATISELVLQLDPSVSDHPVTHRVVFTGDPDRAEEVEKRDPFGRIAATLWDYVRVMHDYAELRERGYGGSLHMYLNDAEADGAKCSSARHASTESDTVVNNRKLQAERMLPVPKEVHPDGKVLMLAHFKPNHSDTFAPRMHYYDDTAASGRIYIGYIGRHLTNTKTN